MFTCFLSVSFFCYLFHHTVCIFHPLQMYFLFLSQTLSFPFLYCVYLSPPGSSPLIPHLLFKVRMALRKAAFSFAALRVPRSHQEGVSGCPDRRFLVPRSRSCSAAAGIEREREGSDLLTHVLWAPGVRRVTSPLKAAPGRRTSSEVTPMVLQNCFTWSFILGLEMSLRCL